MKRTKIILFSLLFIAILFIANNSFATDMMTIEANGYTYSIPDVLTDRTYPDYFIFSVPSYIYVYTYDSQNTDCVFYNDNGNSCVRLLNKGTSSNASSGTFKSYALENNSESINLHSIGWVFASYNTFNAIVSNHDVYYTTTTTSQSSADYDNVFFSATPAQEENQETIPETILAPVIQQQETEMKGTLQQIIQILPLIIVVVVSLVGLRKVLQMLSQVLHKS